MTLLRTVAILRGFTPARTVELAERAWAIGMDLVEVPVQGEAGWAALEAVAASARDRTFGAGTILSSTDASRAIGCGASVVISPSVHPDVIATALTAGAVPLPGVMTPTDVANAARHGVEICKLFPANLVGPGWLEAMRGPFPDIGFVAVGGISAANLDDYLDAGAVGVAFGGSIERFLDSPQAEDVVAAAHARVSRGTPTGPAAVSS
ncbi:bifunctional 4-hydroxy-2-oxoglutarate aldolase/2-dehydro-3-deoxy-phosphogluconate aldolase [Nocardioides sp.]|uniref:bifunctional 4-hydroxy-2-oxoglutarate aldolase/2-dehydro-3-deoxy-phosphogluconate aldolase n=1 Tax=Nocardioides sp. TaxID=35761 RepID=UPI00262602B6|nr:bifunctional 4-hydroxy-2-oxoglutarate aldolase/2-dehydro-3-deoxy-phosphogluconate aldolase [Nocardioides sp.]MCW2739048.1 2-dehydro-3-deoxyphosphogluconate aldolase [Nocardioides sp.]